MKSAPRLDRLQVALYASQPPLSPSWATWTGSFRGARSWRNPAPFVSSVASTILTTQEDEMPDQYDVKVTVGDAEIEVHGAQAGVVQIVKALSEILAGRAAQPQPKVSTESDEGPVRATSRLRHVDARTFFQQKAPSSQVEAIAVAAYYIIELAPPDMRAESIDATKAHDVFRQAKYPLPKRMPQSLVNAQNAGYLKRVGSGEYALTPVGFNLVEHTLGTDG